MSERKVMIRVKVATLYVDGESHPQGAVVGVSAEDAKVLLGRGEAEKVSK